MHVQIILKELAFGKAFVEVLGGTPGGCDA